ncbi:hypothetical protein I7V28_01235 [Lelliottia amnigena]|uniref:hypothetical protein n=1 Tax=Lelliottia amnigena TaxID=61646 RepID=UPI00192CD185|nr:hypothetical protein [Lelliottia amnigena]MBL5919757.1 hypothetical protein [Lelliottia amnigena]
MLEDYFGHGIANQATPEQRKRVIAVEAALAVAIAAAPKDGVTSALIGLERNIESAATAIQSVLDN